jgi:hypothetical protein
LPFVESCIALLFQAREQPLPVRTLDHLLKLLQHSFKVDACRVKLLQYHDKLIGLLLPMTVMTAAEVERVREDPLEFVRAEDDEFHSCPRNTMALLIERMMGAEPALGPGLVRMLLERSTANPRDEQPLFLLSRLAPTLKDEESGHLFRMFLETGVEGCLGTGDQLVMARVLRLLGVCPGIDLMD